MQKLWINKAPIFVKNHLKKKKQASSIGALGDVQSHSSSDFSLWSWEQRHHHSFRKPYAVIMFVGENRLN